MSGQTNTVSTNSTTDFDGYLDVSNTELWLYTTLQCGQCFRWKEIRKEVWRGVIGSHVVTLDQSDPSRIYYRLFPRCDANVKAVLSDYFQLSYNLSQLVNQWSAPKSGKRFNSSLLAQLSVLHPVLKGLRLLRQPPLECLISFLCSQNNNIKRITLMIDRLCREYGRLIGSVDGVEYYAFPGLEEMERVTESSLREMGFGYRAKYFVKAVQQIKEKGGTEWLESLQNNTKHSDEDILTQLNTISGIGPKVADCIALFSLCRFNLVPVDTHVFQIAKRYMTQLKHRKLTKSLHPKIAKLFHDTFGGFAGWAHTILFAGELPVFRDLMYQHGIQIATVKKKGKKKKNDGADEEDGEDVNDEEGDEEDRKVVTKRKRTSKGYHKQNKTIKTVKDENKRKKSKRRKDNETQQEKEVEEEEEEEEEVPQQQQHNKRQKVRDEKSIIKQNTRKEYLKNNEVLQEKEEGRRRSSTRKQKGIKIYTYEPCCSEDEYTQEEVKETDEDYVPHPIKKTNTKT